MERTQVCVVGGGPAGMVLGLLLSRAGIEVTVLEKHADFLRDFRGDTVHPSTMQLLDELGLGDTFAALPQSRMSKVGFPIEDGGLLAIADMSRLKKVRHPYIAMVPQWDLLDMLAAAAEKEPTFTLRRNTECTGLLRSGGTVTGVTYADTEGNTGELRAELTVGTDGRWSTVRRAAGLRPKEFPVSFDTWWFRLNLPEQTEDTLRPAMRDGQFAVVIPRKGYLQIASMVEKGADPEMRAAGIEAFRARLRRLLPEAIEQINELDSLDEVKHLDVRLNRLNTWHRKGVLCIGDAAHAMSPVGGVGINLAVQDAVATASLLAEPLLRGTLSRRDLAKVQSRRWIPTIAVQLLQRLMHKAVVTPVMQGKRNGPPQPLITLLRRFPALSTVPARLIGVGLRPEHAPENARPRR